MGLVGEGRRGKGIIQWIFTRYVFDLSCADLVGWLMVQDNSLGDWTPRHRAVRAAA